MMEKFAARFCIQNDGVFPSPDTAYVLAFAIIMLNTDLHNPNIKPEKKMTIEQFLAQNRGIASGRDLASEYLEGIYSRIATNAISLKEDDEERDRENRRGSKKKDKRPAFMEERRDMVSQATLSVIDRRESHRGGLVSPDKTQADDAGDYVVAADDWLFGSAEHVKPMFQELRAPVCAIFSVNFQKSDDVNIIQLCLDGIKHAVRISAAFNFDDERRSLIDAIGKFTFLDSVRQMGEKHVQCVLALVSIALSEGNYLKSSWTPVLQCVSQVARLQLFATAGRQLQDDRFFSTSKRSSPRYAGEVEGHRRRILRNSSRRITRAWSLSTSTCS